MKPRIWAPGLEELRVLSNINADKHLLLQIILVGQPELRAIIRTPEMLQLAQRISASCHIGALSLDEARTYIHHRLRVAGGSLRLFRNDAIRLAYETAAASRASSIYIAIAHWSTATPIGRLRIDGELMAAGDRRSTCQRSRCKLGGMRRYPGIGAIVFIIIGVALLARALTPGR
jgi:hypothetical protein